jgi:hypothetical protein
VLPGQVGSVATTLLTPSSPAPAGCAWSNGYLLVNSPTTLSNVRVQGGIYDQSGNLTLNNVEVIGGAAWFILMMSAGGRLRANDSTFRWQGGFNPDVGNGSGCVQINGFTDMILSRCDLSGNPDGIQASGTTLIDQCVVHDLAQVGTYPNNTHNDGIQFYAGNLTVRRSYIDTKPARQPYSNSAIFLQGGGIGDVIIEDTYLNGGGYTLYAQNGRVAKRNVTFGPDHLWGEQLIEPPAVLV